MTSCRLLAVVMLSAGVGACTGRAGPSTDPRAASVDPCQLEPASESLPPSGTVVVTAPIEPGRLWLDPNAGERFLLAHLYEPLVRVDCAGAVRPGLASSWRFDPARHRWLITLRDGARFWNGEPATAVEILGAWREAAQREGGADMGRLLEGVVATDERTFSMALGEDSLRVLADPAFLVRRERPGSDWPEGTGSYRLADGAPGRASPSPNAVVSLRLEPMHDERAPRLTIHSVAPAAARDLIDVGIDLLLTDTPDLIAYAASQPGLDTAALAWSRLYLLMTTSASTAADAQPMLPDESRRAQRALLARDVVRVSARAGAAPGWWAQAGSCPASPSSSQGTMRAPGALGIAYDRTDPTAQALAERLAAVTAMGERGAAGDANALIPAPLRAAGSRVTAVGLPAPEFASALRGGVTLAYVIAVPAGELAPCLAQDRIRRRAPWLGVAGLSVIGAAVPLVETHWTVVYRSDRLGLSLQWDGTPLLAPAVAARSRP